MRYRDKVKQERRQAERVWSRPCIVCSDNVTTNTCGVCRTCLQRERDDHAFDWARGDVEDDAWKEPMYQYDAWFLAAFHDAAEVCDGQQ